MSYTPIDCSLHDRLESAATLRTTVPIVYREVDGSETRITDTIVDVYTEGREEFLRTQSDLVIRLDRLVSVDDVNFTRH